MTDTTRYTAVVDRIVDGDTAVFIIEAEGAPLDQVALSMSDAPPETSEGAVFTVTLTDDGELVEFEHCPAEKADRLRKNRQRLERLGEDLDEKRDTE